MSPTGKGKQDIRVSMDKDTYRLVKRLAGVSETSMNSMINQAIERFLESDDIQAVIKRHRLEDDDEE